MGDNSDEELEEVSKIKRVEDFTSDHSGDIVSGINRFRTSKAFCDAELEVGDQIFPIHKCVLASVSDFFFTLFSTEENSSLGGHAKAVRVKDHLYVIGDEKQYSSSVKKMNLKASPFKWENETAMPEEMANISASAMDVYIFAIGTTNIVRQGNLLLMVSYDSTTKQWTTIRHEKRLNFPIPVTIDISTLTSESGCVFNLHGKYYFDAKTKSFKEAPRTSNTVNLVQVGATVYLYERGTGYYDPLQFLMYNPNSQDLCKISTMQNVDTVEKCCLLNGNIVAILKSVNNDFEMKEFNVLTKSWKVIAEIPNIAYFQTIL